MPRSLCAVLVLLACSIAGRGQEIRGKVTDAQGNALVGAAVTATPEEEDIPAQVVQTGQDGNYSLGVL